MNLAPGFSPGVSVRTRVTIAAIAAAALLAGGSMAYAATGAPGTGWFYTSSDASLAPKPVAVPESPFGSGAAGVFPGLDPGKPFSFAGLTAFGMFFASGDAAFTAPHLLSGGLIARDGPAYTVRDLEFVDRLSSDTAFEFGFDADASGRFNVTDVRANPAYSGIFSSIAGFESGLGIGEAHAGASLGLGGGLSLNLGEQLFGANDLLFPNAYAVSQPFDSAIGFDRREAETSFAGVGWKFAPWGSVGLTATHAGARNSLGGMGELSLAKASSNGLGATGQIAFGGGWVTSFSYSEGVTQLDLRPAGATLASESLHNRSYGLAVAKHGLFGNDALGLAVSRPIDTGTGGIDLGGMATADPFDGFISSATRPILNGATEQTDVELGYVTTFMDGALALQANAGYQMNTAGQPGNNSVAVLSRAKINF